MSTAVTVTHASEPSDFVSLTAKDWEGTRTAHLDDIHRTTTVGEVVSESARALRLPFQNYYQALFRGRELNHGDTISEAGLERGAEIELVPEVSAGAGICAARGE